ncbi:MAG: oligosaccharide flippase family protein [Candidatus Methanomethyliaceae archaeon]
MTESQRNRLTRLFPKSLHIYRLTGTLFVNVTTLGFVTLYNILVARLLGPEGRGEITAITNWALFGSLIANLGLPDAIVYLARKKTHPVNSLVTSSIVVSGVSSLVVVGLLYWSLPWLLHTQSQKVVFFARWYLLYIPVQCANAIFTVIPLALDRWRTWNVLRLLVLPAYFFGIISAYVFQQVTAPGIALGILAWYLILNTVICSGNLKYIRTRPRLRVIKELMRFGVQRLTGQFSSLLNVRLDQLVMAAFFPPYLLGLYSAAVVWSNVFTPIMQALSQFIFPYAATKGNTKDSMTRLIVVMRGNIAIGLLTNVLFLGFTPIGFPAVFGRAFEPAIVTAIILTAAAGVAGYKSILSAVLNGWGEPKLVAISEIIGVVVTGVGLLVLLPIWQVNGAAVVSLLSYAASSVYLLSSLSKITGVRNVMRLMVMQPEDLKFIYEKIYTAK